MHQLLQYKKVWNFVKSGGICLCICNKNSKLDKFCISPIKQISTQSYEDKKKGSNLLWGLRGWHCGGGGGGIKMPTEGRSRGDKNLIFQWREGDRKRR